MRLGRYCWIWMIVTVRDIQLFFMIYGSTLYLLLMHTCWIKKKSTYPSYSQLLGVVSSREQHEIAKTELVEKGI